MSVPESRRATAGMWVALLTVILGSVYLVLAVLALVPAGLTVHSAGQDLGWFRPSPAPATPGPPGYCVEHSGGDTRCPGG